jgi:hypothetical protein
MAEEVTVYDYRIASQIYYYFVTFKIRKIMIPHGLNENYDPYFNSQLKLMPFVSSLFLFSVFSPASDSFCCLRAT